MNLIILQMNIIITLILYHMIILHMRSRDRNPIMSNHVQWRQDYSP